MTNEHDPTGRNPNSAGAKLDAGKPLAGLVLGGFASALQEVIKVGTEGANKYTPNGWMSVPNAKERYTNAMLRHWLEEESGELFDNGPGGIGTFHAAQVAWNALARLHFIKQQYLANQVPMNHDQYIEPIYRGYIT